MLYHLLFHTDKITNKISAIKALRFLSRRDDGSQLKLAVAKDIIEYALRSGAKYIYIAVDSLTPMGVYCSYKANNNSVTGYFASACHCIDQQNLEPTLKGIQPKAYKRFSAVTITFSESDYTNPNPK